MKVPYSILRLPKFIHTKILDFFLHVPSFFGLIPNVIDLRPQTGIPPLSTQVYTDSRPCFFFHGKLCTVMLITSYYEQINWPGALHTNKHLIKDLSILISAKPWNLIGCKRYMEEIRVSNAHFHLSSRNIIDRCNFFGTFSPSNCVTTIHGASIKGTDNSTLQKRKASFEFWDA